MSRIKVAALVMACWGLCGISASAGGRTEPGSILENPGFEDGLNRWAPGGWRVLPGEVAFSIDSRIRRSGRRAAKIENLSKNDAFLMQAAPVEPETVYKVSGWIKTEKVFGNQGPVAANLAVEEPWVYSADVKGSSDWQQRQLWVRTAKDQRHLGVQCRLGYWSSAVTGKAWFDDISVEKVANPPPNIRIRQLTARQAPRQESSGYWTALLILAAAIASVGWILRYVEDRPSRR